MAKQAAKTVDPTKLPHGAEFQPVKKTRVSDEVVVQMTNLIISGAFAAGDRLPAERQLAQKLSVNRTSLREALRRMEAMGLVSIRPGEGVFVEDHNTNSGLEFVKFLLTTNIGLDKQLLLDMAEIRRVFATAMIELAAKRASAESIKRLREIAGEYPATDCPGRDTGEKDFEFFHELAKATGNRVFMYTLNTIRDVLKNLSVLYYRIEGDPKTAANLYRRLVEAMEKGQVKKAVSIFRRQMERDDEKLAALLEGLS